jgi:hypothetical protein
MNPHKLFASGQLVNIVDPDPTTIFFSDIVDTLDKTYRHGGQAVSKVSVLHHIGLGVRILRAIGADPRQIQLWLMHDLHEYVIGEIITPMKRAIHLVAGNDIVGQIERRVDTVLFQIAGIDLPTEAEHDAIKMVDRATCLWEAKHIAATDHTNYGYEGKYLELAEGVLGSDLSTGEMFACFMSAASTEGWATAFANSVCAQLPRLFDWIGCDGRRQAEDVDEDAYLLKAIGALGDEHAEDYPAIQISTWDKLAAERHPEAFGIVLSSPPCEAFAPALRSSVFEHAVVILDEIGRNPNGLYPYQQEVVDYLKATVE